MSTMAAPGDNEGKKPNITAEQVRKLRERTGAPMMDCKKALEACTGNEEESVDWLRKRGTSIAAKKAARVTSEGSVASYIHAGGKIGVLVEINCESDFVARTDDFKDLIKDIAMHIAAADPKFVRKEDVTPEAYEREKEIYRAQAAATGKPAPVVEKIRGRQDVKVLRGGLSSGPALCKRAGHHHPSVDRQQNRQAGREHFRPALCPLQSWRRRRDNRYHQVAAGSKSGVATAAASSF